MEKQTEETKKLRKETTMSMSYTRTAFPNLPTEMKDKILLSLPVKTLFRFRCVIRDYLRFHNPNFIKMHLNRQFEMENTSTTTVIVATAYNIYKVDIHSPRKPPIRLDVPFQKPTTTRQMKLVGSCNGLLCLTFKYCHTYTVYLLNPTTRKFKQLPPHNDTIARKLCSSPFLGFGYDHISGKFKVLAERRTGLNKYEAIVYTMGTSTTWRSIGEVQYPLRDEKSQVFGGCPHWILTYLKSDLNPVIVSFNVGNEKFKEIPLPPIDYSARSVRLTALGGRLSMFYGGFEQERYELWVKMDDGLENTTTWTKQLSINFSDINGYNRLINPWGFKNGKVLLGCDGTLDLFNPVNGKVRALNLLGKAKYFEVYSYIEALGMLTMKTKSLCTGALKME
ncbi:F-box/kelch-repeat protein At3g23880-like [Macadamia integrifolia]|uniref:F-box/kelch-repeat protein At3g23880-like n=1 Tax=Macadamia integrifolia TaxID=60698 RepID=UPI001C4F0FB2|nr:F-box/kelch-repeat protein At3g23880-like [Macadamia integrifolia]